MTVRSSVEKRETYDVAIITEGGTFIMGLYLVLSSGTRSLALRVPSRELIPIATGGDVDPVLSALRNEGLKLLQVMDGDDA